MKVTKVPVEWVGWINEWVNSTANHLIYGEKNGHVPPLFSCMFLCFIENPSNSESPNESV